MPSALTLPEELLLLALNDAKGTVSGDASAGLEYGLAGGQLLELAVLERLSLDGKAVVVTNPSPVGDDLLDAALSRIAAEGKPRTVKWWVGKLHGKTKRSYLDRLVARGVVSAEKRKLLGLVPTTRHPEADAGPELEIRGRLRSVLIEGAEADERTVGLVGLYAACSLQRVVFPDRADRKVAKARVRELTAGQPVGRAVTAIVNEVNAAVMGAVVASSIAAGAS